MEAVSAADMLMYLKSGRIEVLLDSLHLVALGWSSRPTCVVTLKS